MKEEKKLEQKLMDGTVQAKYTYEDDSTIYIIVECGMIFVSKVDSDELEKLIEADNEYDDCEAYDTFDGCAYYLKSEYAEEIAETLLYAVNSLFKQTMHNSLVTKTEQFQLNMNSLMSIVNAR